MSKHLNISSVINDEINEINAKFKLATKISKKDFKPFELKDYTYLRDSVNFFDDFATPYYFTFASFKILEHRQIQSFNQPIWAWKSSADESKTKSFLDTQVNLLKDTVYGFMCLGKADLFLQASIIFRSYLEYTSQLYACLLDYDFFLEYTASSVLDEEYKKNWFKKLRPEKVSSKIRQMHAEIESLLKENKIVYGDGMIYNQILKPFILRGRNTTYSFLSGLSHGSYPSISQVTEEKMYANFFLCSCLLIETVIVLDEIWSVYYKIEPNDLFNKWVSVGVYLRFREKNDISYFYEQ